MQLNFYIMQEYKGSSSVELLVRTERQPFKRKTVKYMEWAKVVPGEV